MNEYVDPVGRGMPRLEAREKLTGRAQFTDDLFPLGLAHAAYLGSPYPHARILGYDTRAARAVPGAVAIVTGDDLPQGARMGPFIKDEAAQAVGKVRYVGEPVAAVAAVDLETARKAAALIEVRYEELPAVLSPEDALRPGAPLVHEEFGTYFKVFEAPAGGSTVLADVVIAEGDVEQAWARCDVVVEGEFQTQAQYHAYMEPSSALAEIDAGGKITVWSSNQSVFRVQANVAEALVLPMSRIRCVTPRVGGGFGGKMESTIQPLTAALAKAAGRPGKMTLSREQDMEIGRSRHPVTIRMKTGALNDGTILARSAEIVLDAGAFGDDSPGVAGICALFGRGAYHIENVHLRARAVYTNKLRAGAFRGFGGPQMMWAGEQQIDEIAEKLGFDPLELRIKNAVEPGRRWMLGTDVPDAALVECHERVREASKWNERRRAKAGGNGKRRGIGVACLPHISGLLASGAIVRILEDGTAVLNTGAVDNGQGSDTVLVQMCAQALGLRVDQISFATADTDASPYNWGTSASRVTYMVGRAVVGAADDVVKQLKKHAGEMMECAVEDLELRPGGRIGVKGVPAKEVPFAHISARCHWVTGGPIIGSASLMFDGPAFDAKRSVIKGTPFQHIGGWMFAAQAVEIEVDEGTGVITPLRIWSAHDVGKAINPTAVEGQIEGGVMQGVGYALYEEMVWDSGRLANPSFMDYKIPGAIEVPQEIVPIIVEKPDRSGPFGAKGIGEPPIVGIAPAIGNALHHATGIRVRQLPMTPERVLRALRERNH